MNIKELFALIKKQPIIMHLWDDDATYFVAQFINGNEIVGEYGDRLHGYCVDYFIDEDGSWLFSFVEEAEEAKDAQVISVDFTQSKRSHDAYASNDTPGVRLCKLNMKAYNKRMHKQRQRRHIVNKDIIYNK